MERHFCADGALAGSFVGSARIRSLCPKGSPVGQYGRGTGRKIRPMDGRPIWKTGRSTHCAAKWSDIPMILHLATNSDGLKENRNMVLFWQKSDNLNKILIVVSD